MSAVFIGTARIGAYLVTFLLAAVWIVGALDTLMRPLLDLSRPRTGDIVLATAEFLSLSGEAALIFAKLLAGLKLMVGALLLAALVDAIAKRLHTGAHDDAMLDVSLFIAATASVASALPAVVHGGEPLQAVIGELMLCVIASWLAIYSRGYLVKADLPRPVRPPFGYQRN